MRQKGVIIVTGAAGGIGNAVCKALVQKGFKLFVLCRSNAQIENLRQQFGEMIIESLEVDLSNLGEVEGAKRTIQEYDGSEPIVGFAACSGMADGSPIEKLTSHDLERMFAANTFSLVLLSQAVIALCRRSKLKGRLVFVNSVEGYMTFPFISSYSASKHALEAFTVALRLEYQKEGISATSIVPGFVSTPIWDKAESKNMAPFAEVPNYQVMVDAQNKFVAIGRQGLKPTKVANAVVRAFTVRRPRLRVVVVQIYLFEWLLMRLVPLRLREFLIKMIVGL